MHSAVGGVAHVADIIQEALSNRETTLHEPHITGLILFYKRIYVNNLRKMQVKRQSKKPPLNSISSRYP
jgi:hypothetical protein